MPNGPTKQPPSTAHTSGSTAQRHAGKGAAVAQAIGSSRNGQITKIHSPTDVLGCLGVLLLTLGRTSDATTAPAGRPQAPSRIQHVAAAKG